jgi:hypothetical protein
MPRRPKRIPGELVQASSDVIKNKRVTKIEYARRLSICDTCPLLMKRAGLCRSCGCVMRIKAALPSMECPKGKWSTTSQT